MTLTTWGWRIPLGTRRTAKLSLADDDRVPGVVAALVADDHVHLAGQDVGELALALVAPLGPDDHGGRHSASLLADAGTLLTA